jgi:hypothetical protein
MAALLRLELDPLHARQVFEIRREREVCTSVVPTVDDEAWNFDLVETIDAVIATELLPAAIKVI